MTARVFAPRQLVLLTVFAALLSLAGDPPAGAQTDPSLCNPPNFFVSTFIELLYPEFMPPVGFCIVDNGPGDLNPAVGTIEFDQGAGNSRTGAKHFKGTAEIIPGSAVVSGTNGFGLRLTNFSDTVLSPGSAGSPVLPIFVQNTFTPGVPVGATAVVVTSINGFTKASRRSPSLSAT